MKRLICGLICFLFLTSLFSCTNIIVKAPAGKNIQIASGRVPKAVDDQKMVWYVLWGLVPITDNTTENMLADIPDGSKVFVRTEMTIFDYLISGFLGIFSIQTRTVSVTVAK